MATNSSSDDTNAFMSPKWADVDQKLIDSDHAEAIAENQKRGLARQGGGQSNANVQAQVKPQKPSNYQGDAGYKRGHEAGSALVTRATTARNDMKMKTTRGNEEGWKRYAPGNNRIRSTEERPNMEEVRGAEGHVLKGGLVLFWIVAGIAFGKDLLDLVCAIIDLVGFGLVGTILAAPIGVPLAVFSEIINKIGGFFIDATMLAYFWYIGGKMGMRLAVTSVGFILDAIPAFNVLPMTTITFFLAYFLGKALQYGIVGKVNAIMSVGKKVLKYI